MPTTPSIPAMPSPPAAPAAPAPAHTVRHLADGDRGAIAVWFTLMLIVFVGLAALAVDVCTWYLRSQQLQRAADAAALSAVVHMPDTTSAGNAALVSLGKNNIDTVRVSVVSGAGATNRQYRVALVDRNVPTFFGSIFRPNVAISRAATAEYTTPIRMGSPQNYLGWGGAALPLQAGVPAASATPNFWLALNGYCTAKEHGDLLSARYDGNGTPATSPTCGPVTTPVGSYSEDQSVVALPGQVPSYQPEGYLYSIVTVPGTTTISIYDPGYCPDGPGTIDVKLSASGSTVPLQYVLRSPDIAGTPTDYRDDPVVSTGTYSGCTGALSWVDIAAINATGRYALELKTPMQDHSLGANMFSLRATHGSTALCDARINGNCPQVSSQSALSIMASVTGTARFSFADIAAGYAGKQMVLGLWDPGEGMRSISVVNPSGSSVPFRVRVTPSTTGGPATFTSATQTSLDVSGCGGAYTQPGPNRRGNCVFNDRLVELLVDIPIGYSGGWWSVAYEGGTAPTDRTTWTVRIVGDPVHLTR